MAESVVSFAGETIGKLLVHETKLLLGVEGKIKDLQKELKLIKGLLRDADARREREKAVAEWVAELQDIAYDAEDVIEQYILRVALKKEQSTIKAYACFMAKCLCVQVHAVGIEIEGLKSNISNLRMSMQVHGIQSVNEGERELVRASTPKLTLGHFEEDIVGREDNINMLVEELLKVRKQHRVVFIWGMGGLGKTTLAKKVFTHDKVRNHFEGFAWACVSQEYHVTDILVGILVKLIPDQRERVLQMRYDELFVTLYKKQQEKRCIVVLDDIWTKQAWDGLRAAFPVENTRSKLLITTRNREVAELIDPHGFFHQPECLSARDSWELLKKRVYPDTKELVLGLSSDGPRVGQDTVAGQAVKSTSRQLETEGQIRVIIENMKTLGDELLKKCGGLPLAINVLGGLLAVNDWETVYRNINSHFRDKSDVLKVLALSYDDLPWYLKTCFLYLGSFPTDEEISKTEVLQMWIAEGFVSPDAYNERENTAEDVAEQYLMELVSRGMVQAQFNWSGKIKTCRLHDLMWDLCVSTARQERFLSIFNIQQDDAIEDYSSSMAVDFESNCQTRRLSLNMRAIANGNPIPTVKQIGRTMLHLRTLIFFPTGKFVIVTWEEFQPIFINCKFLRVLKLEGLSWMSGNVPESVGDLVHLRYLSLAGSAFQVLPQSIENLVCMEFLDLRADRLCAVTVPNVLWKLIRLRHLHLPSSFSVDGQQKLRLDSLKYLRTLRNFSPENCDVNDIGKHITLQKLTVPHHYGSDKLEIIPQLAKFTFKRLRSSSFRFTSYRPFTEDELSKMSSYHHCCKLSMRGKIEKLPEPKNLPQQLRKLVLMDSELEEDPMPILEKLHHLTVLLLWTAFVGKEMVCSAGGFPQLKRLDLQNLKKLEELRVAGGAMPHLSRLGINRCFKLRRVPEGLSIYDCGEDMAEEFQKHRDMWMRPISNVSICTTSYQKN
ncbi:disease resistance protein RPP8-like [Rhodamnia argentea]|uniref:Disease resistance protein RPP8-like n=1 Tax=Rhodamnia argentea TaxID=178133 RepID=A0ABM3HTH8_9MYRT|nr:disease resistance protein RPP8-like [Rhodamnia argentea]